MAIKLDWPAIGIARVLIDRPQKRNAVDAATREALIDVLSDLRVKPDCRAIVLGGVGRVFSAGGDLPSMVGLSESQARERLRNAHRLCHLMAEIGVPVVSAAEGWCGGAAVGLALLGDAVIVGRDTQILFPFLRLGLAPDWGLLRSLPARVGVGTARRILTLGRPIKGEEAVRLGVADECVDDDDVMGAAIQCACALSSFSPAAFARMKARLLRPAATLEEELRREEEDQVALLMGDDFREGCAAFAEKRQPRFGPRK